jgi:hypothetical protein
MLLAVAAVASSTQNSTSTVNDVEPGVLGFLVVAAMGLALYFLLRSMNRHLRKLGPKPEEALLSLGDLGAADGAPADAVAGEVLAREDTKSTADAGSIADAGPIAGA